MDLVDASLIKLLIHSINFVSCNRCHDILVKYKHSVPNNEDLFTNSTLLVQIISLFKEKIMYKYISPDHVKKSLT